MKVELRYHLEFRQLPLKMALQELEAVILLSMRCCGDEDKVDESHGNGDCMEAFYGKAENWCQPVIISSSLFDKTTCSYPNSVIDDSLGRFRRFKKAYSQLEVDRKGNNSSGMREEELSIDGVALDG